MVRWCVETDNSYLIESWKLKLKVVFNDNRKRKWCDGALKRTMENINGAMVRCSAFFTCARQRKDGERLDELTNDNGQRTTVNGRRTAEVESWKLTSLCAASPRAGRCFFSLTDFTDGDWKLKVDQPTRSPIINFQFSIVNSLTVVCCPLSVVQNNLKKKFNKWWKKIEKHLCMWNKILNFVV